MKQHITTEQLEELTVSQLLKYAEATKKYWTLSPIKNMPNGDGTFTDIVETTRLPCLSIGQMIEFLVSKEKYVTCDQWINDEYHHWRVGLNWLNEDKFDYICEQKELCDALWMAVKQVIKSSNLRDTMAVHEPISPRANGKP